MPLMLPSVGRIVWYYPSENEARFSSVPFMMHGKVGPFAAIVAAVEDAQTVVLAVFDSEATLHPRDKVHLLDPNGEAPPTDGSYFATWMPYQINQAAKDLGNVSPAPASAPPQGVLQGTDPGTSGIGTVSASADVIKAGPATPLA